MPYLAQSKTTTLGSKCACSGAGVDSVCDRVCSAHGLRFARWGYSAVLVVAASEIDGRYIDDTWIPAGIDAILTSHCRPAPKQPRALSRNASEQGCLHTICEAACRLPSKTPSSQGPRSPLAAEERHVLLLELRQRDSLAWVIPGDCHATRSRPGLDPFVWDARARGRVTMPACDRVRLRSLLGLFSLVTLPMYTVLWVI